MLVGAKIIRHGKPIVAIAWAVLAVGRNVVAIAWEAHRRNGIAAKLLRIEFVIMKLIVVCMELAVANA